MTHENDIERALDFILDLQIQTSIPINAGITYRIAHAGFAGGDFRKEYTTYGRGVNLAARFMSAAPRGEIWIDKYVAKRAGSGYDIEFEGQQYFKGFSEQQAVYVLLERREELENLFQRTLIGRDAELTRLGEFISPLWLGRYAGIAVIWGEAGIGKSHLMQAFKTSNYFSDRDFYWAFCQTEEVLQNSFNPFRYWLKRYFGVSEQQVEARNKRNFNRALDRLIDETREPNLASELDRTRSFLGALVNLYWPDSLYEQLDAQGRYENTQIGMKVLFQAESLRQPVVIHLEDAQWLDGDSKTLLNKLIHAINADSNQSYPLAVIATARPEDTEPMLDKNMISVEINMGELNSQELAQLTEDVLEKPISARLLSLLKDRADGNPFFAVQILRYLQDRGMLELAQGKLMVKQSALKETPVPTDIKVLLIARLDQLTQEVKQVVHAASVLGREFEIQLLTQMLQGDEMLPNKILIAEKASIWSALSQLRYLFRHTLLRETAYRMQIRARRQALHALAVKAIEQVYGEELRSNYGSLAYHCEHAGLQDKALQYLQLAGKEAAAGYANDEALDYYSRAISLVSENQPAVLYDLLMAQEKIHDLQGAREKQWQDITKLIDLAKSIGDNHKLASVMQTQGWLAFNTGDYESAIEDAEQIVHLLDGSQPLNSELVRIMVDSYELWGQALRLRGDSAKSREQLETSLKLAQEIAYETGEMHALEGLGALLWTQANYLEARKVYQQALIISKQVEDPRREWSILNHLGIIAKELGEYTKAVEYYEETLKISRHIGDRLGESIALINLGVVSRAIGDYARARDYALQALPITKEIDDRKGLGIVYTNLGEVCYQIGDYLQAKEYAEMGLEICRRISFRMGEGIILGNLGQVALITGDYEQAKWHAEQALTISNEVGDRLGETIVYKILGDSFSKMGSLEEAENAYKQALKISKSLDQQLEVLQAKAGLAAVVLEKSTPQDTRKAIDLVDEILPYLYSGEKHKSEESCPFDVYIICIRVLRASDDPRTATLLKHAYQELHERASRISDLDMQRSYLENVPVHTKIERLFAEWQQNYGRDLLPPI